MDRSRAQKTLISCPTPQGGHPEHAANIAAALGRRHGVARVYIVGRVGLRNYLGDSPPNTKILDFIPNILESRIGASALKTLLQFVADNALTLGAALAIRPSTVVLEEGRVLAPVVMRILGKEVVLIAHNAISHDIQPSATERIRQQVEGVALRHVDRIVVHGDKQADLVQERTQRPIRVARLPEHGWVEEQIDRSISVGKLSGALCIGEMRLNKGLELAVEAAGKARFDITVMGKAVDPTIEDDLRRAARRTNANLNLECRFLSRAEFDGAIRGADLILLPYSHFEAQSGVLARAMALGKSVVASDLPSLREQAGGYSNITYFRAGSTDDLAEKLRIFKTGSEAESNLEKPVGDPAPNWDQLADAVVTC